ncbi:MAG: hypothetical protein JXJ22_06830 [Bacteroidales bacterium]|nr:hypothetical protein [Bacteroidales bacterium]
MIHSDTKTNSDTLDTVTIKKLGIPINLIEIKKLDFLTVTSGVIPISKTDKLCRLDTTGFFGEYTLINKNTNKIFGNLKVFTTDKPENWRFDNNNEIFSVIELIGKDISLWGELTVGQTESDLKEFIGQNFHYKKGQTIYADFGDYDGTFWINNGVIEKLEIRKICNN